MRTIGIAIALMVLWLLMSGVYKPLTIGLGAASVVLAVFVVRRMDRIDEDALQLRLRPIASLGYFIWLLGEIAKSNWAVTKVILSSDQNTRQHFFAVPFSQSTDLGQVVFANSITLTPGTITVEIEPEHFYVHALSFEDSDHDALADMDARVTATEASA